MIRITLVIIALLATIAPTAQAHLERQMRAAMGTALEIAVFHEDSLRAVAAVNAAYETTEAVEQLLSRYRANSPLSRLNATAGQRVTTTPDLVAYLQRARRDARRTDGAFDITIGALLDAHRGGGDEPQSVLPAVGIEHVRIHSDTEVELPRGMRLDSGGDGKGIAVDAIVQALRAHEIRHAFVNFGGSSIYGLGSHPISGGGWRVAVRAGQKVVGFLTLEDRALSVSDALSPAEDGSLRGHVIDPRSGTLITRARSAAATSPSATDAEVLSTALIVEGAPGLRWLPQFPGAQAAVFESPGTPTISPGFALDPVDR